MAVKPIVRRLLPAGRADAGAGRASIPARSGRSCCLYRSSPPDGARGRRRAGLGTIAAPALVVHGARDRYIPARFADGLAAALGDGRAEHVEGAGHWPWLDRPELVDRDLRVPRGRLTQFSRARERTPQRQTVALFLEIRVA